MMLFTGEKEDGTRTAKRSPGEDGQDGRAHRLQGQGGARHIVHSKIRGQVLNNLIGVGFKGSDQQSQYILHSCLKGYES